MLLRENQTSQSGLLKGNDNLIMLDDYSNMPSLAELQNRIDCMKISSLSALKFDEAGKRIYSSSSSRRPLRQTTSAPSPNTNRRY